MFQDFVSFTSSLSAISDDLRLPILAEGAPMDYGVTTSAQLRQVMSRLKGKERLSAVADLLDFSTESIRSAVLLRKNYSSPLDVPCVSFEELLNFYQGLLPVSKQFSPPYWVQGEVPPDMRWMQDFVRSLEPEKWGEACSKGLLVSDLSSGQRDILKKIVAGSYIGGHYTYLNSLIATLESVRRASFTLDSSGLSLQWQTKFGAKSVQNLSKALIEKNPKLRFFENEHTLGEIEKTTLAPKRNVPGCHVEDYLEGKPIVYASGVDAPPEAIGLAVSRLYDLKFEGRIGGYRVRSKNFPRFVEIGDFQKIWTDAMPVSLRRSILMPAPVNENPGHHSGFRRGYRNTEVSQGALQYLVPSVSEKIKRQKGVPLPFDKSSPRERTALSLWLSAPYIEWFSGHLYEPPPHITRFDELQITCKQYIGQKGRPMLLMRLSCWEPMQNKWRFSIGWGDIWDISH